MRVGESVKARGDTGELGILLNRREGGEEGKREEGWRLCLWLRLLLLPPAPVSAWASDARA